jgi:hypothetical protein
MADRVSTMGMRQRIGDLLNRVALRHDEFIIERNGKALAALVPFARLVPSVLISASVSRPR